MYFFTADEHYDHKNIIKYCKRPFSTVEEMNTELIINHNSVVNKKDTVVHVGDFTLNKIATNYICQLNGTHIFIKGSHDYWLKNNNIQVWEKKIENYYIVACHYAMRVWPRSHYNSIQVCGHSHGNLSPFKNQYDVGVDNNNFYPISFKELLCKI